MLFRSKSRPMTHYHWAIGRDFHTNNSEVTKILHREISTAFEQDREILGIQQDSLIRNGYPKGIDITADSGGIQARRILAQFIAQEQQESA